MENDNKIEFSQQVPLKEETKIGEYLIEKLVSQNGEQLVYQARDSIVGDQVQVIEFYPPGMACRREDSDLIVPMEGCATKYKYFRASFLDLYRTLHQEKDNECLVPIIQILEANGTVYAVTEHKETVTLEEYLEQKNGKEDWCRAKRYLLSLYNSLSNLHKKGVTHQGICPETILMDSNGSPFWSGFALTEMRTVQGEIETQLFSGYSAPEQYQLESWQGTWTDVYSMAAVTYRVLTGQNPPSAEARRVRDRMYSAAELDSSIEPNISEALWEAMELDTNKRYDSIDMLTQKLLQTESSNTAVFRVEDTQAKAARTVKEIHPKEDAQEERRQPTGHSYAGLTMVATLLILIFAAPGVFNYLSSSWSALSRDFPNQEQEQQTAAPLETQEEESLQNSHVVEKLVGLEADEVLAASLYDQWYHFEVVEEYDDKVEKGVIIQQDIAPGTTITRRSTMTIHVSKGPDSVPLPALEGMLKQDAINVLTQMGKQYRIVEGDSTAGQPGMVFRTEPPAGTMMKKESSSQVILYVVKEEKEPPEQEDKKPHKKPQKKRDEDRKSDEDDDDD